MHQNEPKCALTTYFSNAHFPQITQKWLCNPIFAIEKKLLCPPSPPPPHLSSLRHCLNHTSVHSIMLNDDKCDNTCYYYLLTANQDIHVMVFSSYIKE